MIDLPIWVILLFIALLLTVGFIAVIKEQRVEELERYIKRMK